MDTDFKSIHIYITFERSIQFVYDYIYILFISYLFPIITLFCRTPQKTFVLFSNGDGNAVEMYYNP